MKKLNYEDVKEYIESFGYKLLSIEYINNQIPLDMECPCGHICKISFNNFKTRNRRCSKCFGNKKLKEEEVKKELEKINYKLLSPYKNANSDIIVLCNQGHEWTTCWGKIQSGRRCPYCSGKFTHILEVKKAIEKEGYKLLSKNINKGTDRIDIECKKGHIYNTTYNNYKQGHRCPICCESKGEKAIASFLKENKIYFIPQKEFEDCKYKLNLKFDFYLPNYNLCIEYDGEYHYNQLTNSDNEFKNIQRRDETKNKYCEDSNINLLRIPYWEFKNIENILKEKLRVN